MAASGKRKNPEERIRFLTSEIRKHQDLYYKKNQPVISDESFDQMFRELQELEAEYPLLALPDSPTRKPGSDLTAPEDGNFRKFTHTVPVLSLANTYSTEEAYSWALKLTENYGSTRFGLQWKVDGATLVLYYEKGILIRAVTRGSGQTGDDITENAKTIRSIPHRLKTEATLTARGEAYMTFSDFESFNEQYGNAFANPRNLTSGSLKQKNPAETALRPLRWVAFDITVKDRKFSSDSDILRFASECGLPVFEDNAVTDTDHLKSLISEYEDRRDAVPFPVDGLVIKADSLQLRDEAGFTAHSPRWATALKFTPESAVTEVKDIQVFTGRTGRVTPRAALKPVKIAGTTVSYATLHNFDFIDNLGVRPGSKVRITKRGEIIPAVEEVLDPGPGPDWVFPKECPACGTPLIRDEDAKDFICPSSDCSEKLKESIIFFAARKQMDIAGLGDKVVRILFDKGFIKYIEDLYTLKDHRDELTELEGFGEKSISQLLAAIEKSRSVPFRKLLYSLGLKEIGPSVSSLLIQAGYSSFEALKKLAEDPDAEAKLTSSDGIGPRTAAAVISQFKDPVILRRIESLTAAGLASGEKEEDSPTAALPEEKRNSLKDTVWVITGSFENFRPRDLAANEITARGGKTAASVSSKTTHLLCGENSGSKEEKARQLGVRIVTEAEFMKML